MRMSWFKDKLTKMGGTFGRSALKVVNTHCFGGY
jgi:hypothetical protein